MNTGAKSHSDKPLGIRHRSHYSTAYAILDPHNNLKLSGAKTSPNSIKYTSCAKEQEIYVTWNQFRKAFGSSEPFLPNVFH